MSNRKLFRWNQDLFQEQQIKGHLVATLAMMMTGMLLSPHVQLFAIAMCVPLPIKLNSIVRRFERFVADERVDVQVWFEPFVRAMQISLGNETAYLLIDCTQAGPKCRTLLIGLSYHGTVLLLIWKTIKGKKGHVKGEFQRALPAELYPKFRYHIQSNYRIQTAPGQPWLSAQEIYEAQKLQAGQVQHWDKVGFTQAHQIADLTMTVLWEAEASEALCLISSLPVREQPHLIYDMRFWVETLFGNQKSRGFQLARTQMTTPQHIDRLILAVAIAACISLGLGTHLIVTQQTDQVDRADRRDLSLFQLGWRWLYRLLALDRLKDIKIVFSWDFKLPPPGFQPAR